MKNGIHTADCRSAFGLLLSKGLLRISLSCTSGKREELLQIYDEPAELEASANMWKRNLFPLAAQSDFYGDGAMERMKQIMIGGTWLP